MKILFIFSFIFLISCSSEPQIKSYSFQECTVSIIPDLKFRPLLGLLSKSCYLKSGEHNLGIDGKETGECLVKKITEIRTLDQGKQLIEVCAKKNQDIKNFLLEVIEDD